MRTKAKATTVPFNDEEKRALQDAARAVWEEVAYDLLQAVAEEQGKDINRVTVSRAEVIEVALDAGRSEEILRSRQRRDAKAGRPAVVTDDLLKRMDRASYEQLIAIS